MAVVRFSDNLKAEIINKAGTTFAKRETDALALGIPHHEVREHLVTEGFGPYLSQMQSLPSEFFEVVSHFTLLSFGECTVHMRFEFPNHVRWPRLMNNSYAGMKFRNNGYNNQAVIYIPDLTNPEDVRIMDAFKARRDAMEAVRKAKQDYVQGVTKLCNSFTTLAPALKAWPPLWDLLPDSAVKQHQKITTRDKNSMPDLSGVDLTSLTVQSTIAKMSK
jgi:hypothetical protein